jgi:hypothetical protein
MNDKKKFPVVEKAIELSSSVDWLTCTAKSPEARIKIYELCAEFRRDLAQNGKITPWRFRGYQGLQCESVRWGTRADSDIAVLSGYDAAVAWRRLLPVAENVSRVDLAVTIRTRNEVGDLVQVYYDWVKQNLGAWEARKLTKIENNKGGQTLYVGSRASDQFGRIYDKGAQDKKLKVPPGCLWRYEVEFKEDRAGKIASQLRNSVDPNASPAQRIQQTVYLWFDSRDVPPLFCRAKSLPLDSTVSARVTTDEKALAWLHAQVAPTVARLMDKGKADATLQALGVQKWVIEELASQLDDRTHE